MKGIPIEDEDRILLAAMQLLRELPIATAEEIAHGLGVSPSWLSERLKYNSEYRALTRGNRNKNKSGG